MSTLQDVFGNLIFSYTRRQAIEDGVLVNLSASYPADTRIFKYPVACTDSVWGLVMGRSDGSNLGPMVWDLCWMAARCVISRPDPTTAIFKVILWGRTHTLKAVCGPNDDATPCLTIMLPEED